MDSNFLSGQALPSDALSKIHVPLRVQRDPAGQQCTPSAQQTANGKGQHKYERGPVWQHVSLG